MKFIKTLLLSLALLISFSSVAEYVSGYYKSNGTYVQPYYRSDRNSTVTDNYSYYGNINPYTGKVGTNKYYDSPSSDYYRGRGMFDQEIPQELTPLQEIQQAARGVADMTAPWLKEKVGYESEERKARKQIYNFFEY